MWERAGWPGSLKDGRSPMRKLLLAALICGVVPAAAADPPTGAAGLQPGTPAARCAALIAQFDAVIVNRFDYRILMLEDYELAEARYWRAQAEAECGAGRYDFGIALIAGALKQIGVVPEPGDAPPPDQP
jgi:hypothetical protein